ncbi:hypothetical protein GCM10027592_29640 [Spirosoma flavus]
MPSNAYINFLYIRVDVLRLIETHSYYTQNRRGRKNLGHLTRSAVVMLCAAWERYNEDLIIESIQYLNSSVNDVNLLNNSIKKTISKKVKEDKHDLKPLAMAGDGWKDVWLAYARLDAQSLNTPKAGNLKLLYNAYLGIEDCTTLWGSATKPAKIDAFVTDRGGIAHNGARAGYIRMNQLRLYQDLIVESVIEMDSNMALKLQAMAGTHNPAWERLYSTELSSYM